MEREITFDELVRRVSTAHIAIERGEITGLTEAAILVRDAAKAKFGKYQPGWKLLNPEYVAEKVRAGAPGDDPLIGYYKGEDGRLWPVHLKDTFEIEIIPETKTAIVGTRHPAAPWHEEGRVRPNNILPPRPFLRPAVFENEDRIGRIIKDAVAQALREHFFK
jgi:hypothetical protein